ncbi:MAG: hypothetical protein VKJ64_22015 [Leptolyngbyaceae bacterium]|nr:hypothetical protein [Leptolyngbyaceae bacterium]
MSEQIELGAGLMVMNVTTAFDGESADKLAYIQAQTNEDIAEILDRALAGLGVARIDWYYQQLRQPAKSPLEIFEDLGLVGCIDDAEPDLSSAYQSHIQGYLQDKQQQDRF